MTRGETRAALGTIGDGLRGLLRQRWIRVLVVVAVITLGLRVVLTLLLAHAVDLLAEPRDLRCEWAELDLSLLSGKAEMRYLELGPRARDGEPPGAPLVEIEFATFDLELLPLFVGDLRIRRAEIDGADARVERTADGTWNLERHVDIAEVLALLEGSEEEPPAEDEGPQPIDLAVPLAIEALRMQHARLHIVDHAVSPPIDSVYETNVRLSNLATSERPARFSLSVTGGAIPGGATIEGQATWSTDSLTLRASAQAGGIRPAELDPYLAALDIRPACETLDAGASLELELGVSGPARDGVQATVVASGLHLRPDGAEAFALDELRMVLADAGPGRRVEVDSIEVSGPRGRVELPEPDALRIAGFDLLASGGGGGGTEQSAGWASAMAGLFDFWLPEAAPGWMSLFARVDPQASAWSVGRLSVAGGSFAMLDRTVEPHAELAVVLDDFQLGALVHDPSVSPEPITLTARLHAPGTINAIRINGSIQPFAPKRMLDLTIAAEGIALTEVDPYLRGAGFEQTLERGTFDVHLVGEAESDATGRTTAWIEVREAALRDTGELFGVQRIAARELLLDPQARLLRLGDIEVDGPRLALRLDASSGFAAFGLRTLGAPSVARPTRTAGPAQATRPAQGTAGSGGAAPSASAPSGPVPRIELGRLAWTNSDVRFIDERSDPPSSFRVGELGFELTGLVLGGDPGSAPADPARFTARFVAEGMADDLSLEGAILSRPGTVDLEASLALRGSGLNAQRLAPYFAPFGVAPTLVDGQLTFDVEATLSAQPSGWRAGLALTRGALTDGATRWFEIDELRLDDVLASAAGLEVGALTAVGPRLFVERREDGAFAAAGMRQLVAEELAGETPQAAAREPAPLSWPALPPARIHAISVEDARVVLQDRLLSPALDVELVCNADATSLSTDGDAGTFDVRLSVPGALDVIATSGQCELGPGGARVSGRTTGTGWRAGPFARFLPPGVAFDPPAAHFAADWEASVAPVDAGGLGFAFGASDVSWGEATDAESEPWFALDALEVAVARFDPVANRVELGPLSLRGARVSAARSAAGELRALGLTVSPATATAESTGAPVRPAADPARPAVDPVAPEKDTAPRPPGDVLLPTIVLAAGADVSLERFFFRDETLGADARPLEASLQWRLEPGVLVDEQPAELPALRAQLEGRIAGIVEELRVEASARPFALEPRFDVRWDVDRIRTAGVVELLPALAASLQGDVEEGRIEGSLGATLEVRRSRPNELGLARGFGADVRLEGLAYRDAPGGTILAGVDSIDLDVKRVDPARGRVHIETIEVEGVRGTARLEGQRLFALGFVAAAPQEGSAEPAAGATPNTGPGEASEPRAATEPSAEPASTSTGELRIDQVYVSGIDVSVSDPTLTPPFALSLVELDAELKRFSTRAWQERRPFQFSAYVAAAPSDPEDAASAPTFDELALSGRVAPYPVPAGWVQLQLSGLELTPFAGFSAPHGIDIVDGALEAGLRIRLDGERGARVGTNVLFTDLDLDEPEGGALENALGLPVGLETALFLTASPDGEHSFSAGLQIDDAGVSLGDLALAAAGAVGDVVVATVAGAPFRLLGALIPGSAPAAERHEFPFSVGASELALEAREQLEWLAIRLQSDPALRAVVRHELSAADRAQAERLANPTEGQCLELAAGLRQRKLELWRGLEMRGVEARALYAVGATEARAASSELLALERELAGVEASLDEVLEVLRADSTRQRERRTRTTCRELSELRLEEVERLLRSRLLRERENRIDVRSPRAEIAAGALGRVVVELRRD